MTEGEVAAQLERIVASQAFSGSERMSRFLRYVVGACLEGRSAELKESVLGVHVFDRRADYDARVDPIVRVEARRLRAKLAQYYESEGREDALQIELPTGGYVPAFRSRAETPAPQTPRTVAVLPFANLSAEPENQYFSDGLTRELIHELTRIPGLRVMAWNSVAQLREKAGRAREVGDLLHADTVLEGSVQRAGRRVRITAQLVETATGLYLWSETYQREWEDVFSLQEEIARTLAMVLKIRLTVRDSRHAPRNAEAYHFYLQGRHAWNQRTEAGLRQSISLLERALEKDPEFALAWAGIADSYSLLCDFGHLPAHHGIPQARRAAERALELDPTLGEAHCSLGFIQCTHDWQWPQGEKNYLRALELNPGYATAHHWYGTDFLALWRRFPEAAAEMALARALDPLDTIIEGSECYLYFLWRRYDEAERRYQALIQRAPDLWRAISGLGRVLGAQGRYAEAVAMMEKARQIAGDVPSLLGALAQLQALSGNRAKARVLLDRLRHTARQHNVPATCFVMVHLGLGERGDALNWLERALANRELPLTGLKAHPAYDELRGEPRFQAVLEQVGFTRD
jgi:serine/threonine-protein kinase